MQIIKIVLNYLADRKAHKKALENFKRYCQDSKNFLN